MPKGFLVFLTAFLVILAFPYSFAHEDEADPEHHDEGAAADSVKNAEGDKDGKLRIGTEGGKKDLIRDAAGNIAGERKIKAKAETRVKVGKGEILGRDAFTGV